MLPHRIFSLILCTFAPKNYHTMKKATLLISTIALAVITACGSKQAQDGKPSTAISTHQNMPGDSTRYGLACDGCTDSLLVFLPYSGGDPDTFDIIEAQKQRRVFGRAHIGDELAVLINPENRHEALAVININQLQGQWCYMVTPSLRKSPTGQPIRQLPDSVLRKFMTPREYGIRLKRDNTAHSTGGMRRQTTTDDMTPVEYPPVKYYTEWRIHNGHIILKADTVPGMAGQSAPESDTVDILLLRRDTLVLRYADHEQGFYRKKEEKP